MRILRSALILIALSLAAAALSSYARLSTLPETEDDQTHHLLVAGPAVALPSVGVPQQMLAFAAPDEPDRLLACASESDSANARLVSAVYVSLDGGNTWMRTLLDADSDWVSEIACAIAPRGLAYFSAGNSDTRRGALSHSSGSAEIFRSSDGGLTWTGPRRYPFIDWMQMAASQNGTNPAVYLFGNVQAAGEGDTGTGAWMERYRPLRRSEDGLNFSSPAFPEAAAEEREQAFPISAVMLPDGRALALFAEIRTKTFALYEATSNSYRLLSRVTIPPRAEVYGPLSAQMAYARGGKFSGRLYVAIPILTEGKPALALAVSDDLGSHWASRVLLRAPSPLSAAQITYLYAGVAVNPAGIVGIEWLSGSGCPMFAVSLDGGESIADSIPLGACPESERLPTLGFVLDQNLDVYSDRSPIEHPLAFSINAAPGFSIRAAANLLGAVQIAADTRGRFHAFWTEAGSSSIRTLTATISIGKPSPPSFSLAEVEDITHDIAVHVERQRFDPETASFDVDLSLRDIAATPIAYPDFLEVVNERSDCGHLEYLNASASLKGNPSFRVPRRPDRQKLFPGEDSLPVHIKVAARGCGIENVSLMESARTRAMQHLTLFPLAVRFRVYASRSESPSSPR